MREIIESFAFPQACLVNKRIAKTLFQEQADLTPQDKKLVQSELHSLHWVYRIRAETAAIAGFSDETRDYRELALLTAQVKSHKTSVELALHRAFPYPLILLMEDEAGATTLSLAHKRLSLNEKEKQVLEDEVISATLTENIIKHLSPTIKPQDLYALYCYYENLLLAHKRFEITGKFHLLPLADKQIIKEVLIKQRDVEALKKHALKAKAMREQVECAKHLNEAKEALRVLIDKL